MEITLFKKIVNEAFKAKQFVKRGAYYYREGEDCICIVGIQRSSYSNGYYVSVGFALKKLHADQTKLKDTDGDVRARFSYDSAGETTDFYDLDKLSADCESSVSESFRKNIDELVEPALQPNGLKVLLARRPVLLYQTTLAAKQLLGLE
ncbi:MAG TPA: DUF4304 domain-containing protein [Puia sp.]|nr:DUF4304 domain-containing protein [Puia sp.]